MAGVIGRRSGRLVWLLAVCGFALLLLATSGSAQETEHGGSRDFTDLSGHWSESFVRTLYYAGVLSLPEDGKFRPDEPVTRRDFTVWLARSMELRGRTTAPAEAPFSDWADIPEEDRPLIWAAVEEGLIQGYPDGSFRPEASLTRAEMGTLFGRALAELDIHAEDRYRALFADGETIPDWAFEALASVKAGIIIGIPESGRMFFRPQATTSRAETATMIVRFIDLRVDRLGIERPQAKVPELGRSLAVGYYINTDAAYESLLAFGEHLDLLIYSSYTLADDDGSLQGIDSPRTMSWAADHGVPLVAMIAAHDRAINDAFFENPEAQAAFVSQAVSLTDQGYAGIHLDFEYVSARHREAYTELIQQLSQRLRSAGKHLSIAVPAKTREDLASDWVGAFDYRAIGRWVDHVTIMTYDLHWPGGPPGPVGSLTWMRSVLQYAAGEIPPEKLWLGIPAYGYDWPLDGGQGRSITSALAAEMAGERGVSVAFDPATAEESFRYVDPESGERVVYYTPPEGLSQKLELVAEYGLGGFAMWRMGQEMRAYWPVIRESLPR